MSGLLLGLVGGAVSGLATTLGAVPVLLKSGKAATFLKNINMDFVIGLMLSAAAFSLILPAYQKGLFGVTGVARGYEFLIISAAVGFGTLFISVVGKYLGYLLRNNARAYDHKKATLFIIAMMVHNFPEGLASGATMTMQDSQGYSLLSAIAVQNVPEGLTTALSFIGLGLNPVAAFAGNFLTALVEVFGGLLGGYLSTRIEGVLPFLMAFAGGAMMNVVIVELLDRLKSESYHLLTRPGFIAGMALVIILNNINL
jgi:ZIP family zinc transporter